MIPKEQLLDKTSVTYNNFAQSSQKLFAATLYEYLKARKQQQKFESLDAYAAEDKKNDPHLTSFIDAEKALLETLETIIGAIVIYYEQQGITPSDFFLQELIEAKSKNAPFIPLSTEKHISLLCKNSHVSRVIYKKDLPNTIKIDQEPIPILIQFISFTLQHLMEVEGKNIKQEIQQFFDVLAIKKDGSYTISHSISPEEIEKTFVKLQFFLEEKQVLSPAIHKLLTDFNSYEKEEYKILHQHSSLVTVLILLNQEVMNTRHHLQFVEQFGRINENGNLIDLNATKLIHNWQAKRNNLERVQESHCWREWQEIKGFYSVYSNFDVLRLESLKREDLLEEWRLCEIKKKIEEIAQGKQNHYMKKLKKYATKVFYIEQSLLSSVCSTPSNKQIEVTPQNQNEDILRITASLDEEKKHLILTECDSEFIALSLSGKIKFRRYSSETEETIQLRMLILLFIFPKGLSKQKLARLLKKSDRQSILDAYPKINEKLPSYVVLNKGRGILSLNNTKYVTTTTFNPEEIAKGLDINQPYLTSLLQKYYPVT